MTEGAESVRLDKWLWAARFFKTRSQAAEAVAAGHVDVNEVRAKAARSLKPGDTVEIRKGREEFVVIVRQLSDHRGSATQAQQLYEETEASRRAREERAEQHRLAAQWSPAPEGRPDKRDRRRIIRFVDKGR